MIYFTPDRTLTPKEKRGKYMATRALDVITIMHALSELEGELGIASWRAKNQNQEKIFAWLEKNRELLAKITGLDAKASRFWEELNRFLTDRKFDPMVEPFDPDEGIGVVSVLDKLVKWKRGPADKVMISTMRGTIPGFELPWDGVNIYEVDGYPASFLLELLTKSDDTLWLFAHKDTGLDGMELAELSMDVMSRARREPTRRNYGRFESPVYSGAQVPMLDFDIKPDIGWLAGADTTVVGGKYYFISQASQQFKMRMDETGARVKVATVVVMLRGMGDEPKKFVLDHPFYGWWMQKGLNLPMAAFFADWDSLHEPAGKLEDL